MKVMPMRERAVPYRRDTTIDLGTRYVVVCTTYSGARFLSETFKLLDAARAAMVEYKEVTKRFGGGRVAIYEYTRTGGYVIEYDWV